MEFLKKHYEKIILCVVLLGLAAAAIWMRMAIDKVQDNLPAAPSAPSTADRRGRGKSAGGEGGKASIPILDLSTNERALALATNPPAITLSGENNLFNPVTWKRKSDGTLLKVVKQGPDALMVTNITPLYTIISYDHASGSGVYVMGTQTQSDLQHPKRVVTEFAKKNEKVKSGLYIIRDVKGDADNPSEIDVELTVNGEIVPITKEKPFQREDSCIADLRYEPEQKTFYKVHVNEPLRLDGEQYKVVEITNNAVRIQFNRTTKVTEINWKK
jgi:hypothetical protein